MWPVCVLLLPRQSLHKHMTRKHTTAAGGTKGGGLSEPSGTIR